jgi:hypothetical protein
MRVLLVLLAIACQTPLPSTQPINPIQQKVSPNPKTQKPESSKGNKATPILSTTEHKSEPTSQHQKDETKNNPSSQTYTVDIRSLPFPPPDPWFRFYVFLTAIIALIGVATLFAILRQSVILKWQLKEQHDLTVLEHRARMQLDKIDFKMPPNKRLPVRLYFKNTGRTPAKGFRIWAFIEYTGKEGFPQTSYEKDRPVMDSAEIPPQLPLCVPIEGRVLDSPSLYNIVNGIQKIFIHGRLIYRDIFGCDHWLEFCHELDPAMERFMIYPKHNGTDDQ